jgi:hypothetical protein
MVGDEASGVMAGAVAMDVSAPLCRAVIDRVRKRSTETASISKMQNEEIQFFQIPDGRSLNNQQQRSLGCR